MSMIYKEGTASLTKGSPVLKGKDTYFLNPIFNVGVGQIVQVKTGDNVYVNSIKEVVDNETLILSFDSISDVGDGEIVIMITMVDSISDTANKLLGMTRGLVQFETEMTKWFTSMDKKITITLPDGTKKEVYTLQAIMEQVAQNEKEMQELLQNSEKKVNDMVDKAQTDVNNVVTDGTNKINQAVDKADKEINEAITSGTGKIDTMLTESQEKIDKTIEDTEAKVDTELGKIDEKIGNRIDGKVDKTGDRMSGSLGIDSKEFSQSIEINADAEQDRTSIGNKFKDGSLAILSFYKDRMRYAGKDVVRDGDYGIGYKANTNSDPSQTIFSDANDITYSGFGTGNAKSTNFFDYGSPLISAARFGGSDSTGQVFQLQSRVSKTNSEIAYRTRNTNEWTDWLKLAILDTVQTQTFKGAVKARQLDVEKGNDYFGLRIHADNTPAFYSFENGKGKDFRLTTYGDIVTTNSGGNPNLSDNRILLFRAKNKNQAAYIEYQNPDGSMRWRLGSQGNDNRCSIATSTMSAGVEQINSIASKGFYLDSNLMMDINGGYEHRFYGFGTKPGTSHTMMFARDTDKTIGFNFRNEDGYVGTLMRIDGKNKVVKVNEIPVLVEGDFGVGRAGLNSPQNISCFQGVNSASVQGFPTNGAGIQATYQTNRRAQMFMSTQGIVFTRFSLRDELVDVTTPWKTVYSSQNTTIDSNGFLKRASPIIKIFGDGSFETNDESDGAFVKKIGVGVYKIENVLGLNSDESWGGYNGGFEIPLDNNKLAVIWVDYDVESDGSIVLKTYHREHKDVPPFARNLKRGYKDGDPCDIPSGRFVSVRVNMPDDSIFNQMIKKLEQEDKEMESNPFYKEERAFPNIIFNKKGDL